MVKIAIKCHEFGTFSGGSQSVGPFTVDTIFVGTEGLSQGAVGPSIDDVIYYVKDPTYPENDVIIPKMSEYRWILYQAYWRPKGQILT